MTVIFDGGSVSHFLGHFTGGYKLVDKRAKHPKTKEALFGESGHEKMQSHIHCFSIKVALALRIQRSFIGWSLMTFSYF